MLDVSYLHGFVGLQDPKRGNWGGLLPPGRYSTITTRSTHMVAAVVPAKGGGHALKLAGDYVGTISTTGVFE